MFRLFLKNNLFKHNIPIKASNNLYETRDCIINQVPIKINEYKNYYKTEEFKQYKPNLKTNKNERGDN